MAKLLNNLALSFSELGDLNIAHRYIEKALDLSKEIELHKLYYADLAFFLDTAIDIAIFKNNRELAISYLN